MRVITNKIIDSWYRHPRWWTYLLWPLAQLFSVSVIIRRWLYKKNYKKSIKMHVPVIIVGNISVGGTGKTPLVIHLAQLLRHHNYRPGIVSRGYGGDNKICKEVASQNNPRIVGDEPVLLAKRTGCPVVIGRNRTAAVNLLLAEHDCDIVISDDGLQHYKLVRDIEIAVIDGKRRLGNRLSLPAGPLRESINRLSDFDFIVCNGDGAPGEYSMQLIPDRLINLVDSKKILSLSAWQGKTVHAVAGIGNPEKFFTCLSDAGINVLPHSFPDHYCFRLPDITFDDAFPVVMTEKDAVKCKNFDDNKLWCLPVTATLTNAFDKSILQALQKIKRG